MKRFLKLVTAVLGMVLAFPGPLYGQDIFKRTTTPFIQFGGPGQPAVPWGSGAGAFNNVFWFNTLQPEQGVCVWVTNNNPNTPKSFSLVMNSTGNPNVGGFTNFESQWTQTADSGSTAFPFSLNASTTKTFFFAARSAAFMAMKFTGSTAGGGPPDTATLSAVLTNAANCSAVVLGNTVIGPTPDDTNISVANQQPVEIGGRKAVAGVGFFQQIQAAVFDQTSHGLLTGVTGWINEGATIQEGAALSYGSNILTGKPPLLQVMPTGKTSDVDLGVPLANNRISRRYGQTVSSAFGWASDTTGGNNTPLLTYNSTSDAVNPVAGFLLLSVTTGNNNIGLTPHKAYISCSATCDVTVNRVSTAGTTCTANTIVKTFDPSLGLASNAVSNHGACVANPTIVYTAVHLWLAANSTQIFDFEGYWTLVAVGTGNGWDIQNGTNIAAGTVSVTLDWAER